MRSLRPLVVSALLLCSCFIPSCSTVPETGRSQLLLISASEEAAQGLQAFSQLKQQEKVSTDAAATARVRRIGERIAAAVGRDLPNAQWEFVVFESDEVNAFALPGGKVGFYQGLLKLASSDDEVAAVMGHEVAHVTARHGGERMSQQLLVGIGGAAAGLALQDNKYRDAWLMAYAGGTTLGVLGYSRLHETEADTVGLRYAADAGYDPRASVTFWKKMAAKKGGGGGTPTWLSTHPSDEQRIARLEAIIPDLMPVYEASRGRYE